MPSTKVELLPVTQAVTQAWAAIVTEYGGYMSDGWNGDYPEKLAMDAAVEALGRLAHSSHGGEELREALVGFVAELTDNGRNRGTCLSINHDALTARVAAARALLASPPPLDRAEAGKGVINRSKEWWLRRVSQETDTFIGAGVGTPDFLTLVKRLVVAARTTGGTAGPDAGLMAALDDVEQALPQPLEGLTSGEGCVEALREIDNMPHYWPIQEAQKVASLALAASPFNRADAPTSAEGQKLDWLHIAKTAGKYGIRYPTNRRLEAFLSEIAASPSNHAGSVGEADHALPTDWEYWLRDAEQVLRSNGTTTHAYKIAETRAYLAALHPIDSRAAQEKGV